MRRRDPAPTGRAHDDRPRGHDDEETVRLRETACATAAETERISAAASAVAG